MSHPDVALRIASSHRAHRSTAPATCSTTSAPTASPGSTATTVSSLPASPRPSRPSTRSRCSTTIAHDLDRNAPRTAGPARHRRAPVRGRRPAHRPGAHRRPRRRRPRVVHDARRRRRRPNSSCRAASPTRFTVAARSTIRGVARRGRRQRSPRSIGASSRRLCSPAPSPSTPTRLRHPRGARRLPRTQPGCIVYADGGFVGASPELLVDRRGEHVTCRPLAGTGADADELLRVGEGRARAPTRRRRGQRRAAHAAPTSCTPTVPRPSRSPTSRTSPRRSPAHGDEGDRRSISSTALHPTPAVAGTPRDVALDLDRTPRTDRAQVATPARADGSTRAATASSSSRCAAPRSPARARCCTPARASSRAPIPTPNGPRRRRSSDQCCTALVAP